MNRSPPQPEFEDVTLLVAGALESIGAEYFLVGSVASSLQGEPRATNDIDFVLRLSESQVEALGRALGPSFSVDEESVREAARARGSWNVYYLPLVTKVDLFFAGDRAFEVSEFARRRHVTLGPGAGLFVASPEDNVLFKLTWFQRGGEVSTTQWRDVLGVLRVSARSLDLAYLDLWAERLGVTQLLQRARAEVG